MGALLRFPTEAVQSTFDQGWAARQGEMKTRGEGKDKTRKLWNKEAARLGGQDVLLSALQRFFREKPEKDGYTHPGLSVWLNQQRADHWVVTEAEVVRIEAGAFPDKRIRDAVLASQGLPFVVSYLDPCVLIESPNGPLLQPKTDYARRKLLEHAGLFKSLGLYGIRSPV